MVMATEKQYLNEGGNGPLAEFQHELDMRIT